MCLTKNAVFYFFLKGNKVKKHVSHKSISNKVERFAVKFRNYDGRFKTTRFVASCIGSVMAVTQ